MVAALASAHASFARHAAYGAECACAHDKRAARVEVGRAESLQSSRASIARELDFSVRTRDGDTVRVRLVANDSAEFDLRTSANGNLALRAATRQEAWSVTSVNGALDEAEQAAITALAGQAAAIAERFFTGEEIDPGSLAEFTRLAPELSSLDFAVSERSERVSQIATYRDVAGASLLADAGAWRRALAALLAEPRPADGRFDSADARADVVHGIASALGRLG